VPPKNAILLALLLLLLLPIIAGPFPFLPDDWSVSSLQTEDFTGFSAEQQKRVMPLYREYLLVLKFYY